MNICSDGQQINTHHIVLLTLKDVFLNVFHLHTPNVVYIYIYIINVCNMYRHLPFTINDMVLFKLLSGYT